VSSIDDVEDRKCDILHTAEVLGLVVNGGHFDGEVDLDEPGSSGGADGVDTEVAVAGSDDMQFVIGESEFPLLFWSRDLAALPLAFESLTSSDGSFLPSLFFRSLQVPDRCWRY